MAASMMKNKGRLKRRMGRIFLRPESAVFALYGLVTIVFTYPAITLLHRTYAEKRDPLGALWSFWWFRYAFGHGLPLSNCTMVAVPFGWKQTIFGTNPLTSLITVPLSIIAGETVAYNLILLLSFFLTALAMYFFARRLTGNRAAAGFAGFAFAFCPFMLAQGKEHIGLLSAFWLPLFALFLIKALEKPGLRPVVWCAVILVLTWLYNLQYGMMAALFAVVFVPVVLLVRRRRSGRREGGGGRLVTAAVVCLVLVALAGLALVALRMPRVERREMSALYQYSARPWEYVLPGAESTLLGGRTRGFLTRNMHGSYTGESSLFLGYVPLLLSGVALCGAAAASRRRRGKGPPGGDEPPAREDEGGGAGDGAGDGGGEPEGARTRRAGSLPYVLGLLTTGAVAFLVSMPPTATVLRIKLYFPSWLLYKVVPQFRAYSRFGVLVMFCVAALAACGVSFLLENRRLARHAVLVTTVLCVLVLAEFAIVPPFYSLETNKTTDYFYWLAEQPGKPAAAIYPMYMRDEFNTYGYLFFQRLHSKPLLDGYGPEGDGESYRQVMLDITDPDTPGLLRLLGADYVMALKAQYELPQGPSANYKFPVRFQDLTLPPGLEKVASFPACDVYAVTAPKALFVARFLDAPWQPFTDPAGAVWHPGLERLDLVVDSRLDRPETRTITFMAVAPAGSGDLVVSLNGKVVGTVRLGAMPVEVVVENASLKPGENSLVLETDAAASPLPDVSGFEKLPLNMVVSNVHVD
ncbi:MAG: hypothetical protein V1748_00050 [Actinomycetota bacterium]